MIAYSTFRDHRKRVVKDKLDWGGLPFDQSELSNWIIVDGIARDGGTGNKGDDSVSTIETTALGGLEAAHSVGKISRG